jgi:hypothetical protein
MMTAFEAYKLGFSTADPGNNSPFPEALRGTELSNFWWAGRTDGLRVAYGEGEPLFRNAAINAKL